MLDACYERGGSIDRADGEFEVYFPCAYAIQGEQNDVPGSIVSRSHLIKMRRRKPAIPAALSHPRNPRLEDNCLPLIAVADTFGEETGKAARAALIEFCADLPLPDAGVQVLEDIRSIPFEWIEDKELVEVLKETSNYWDSWRGPDDKGAPHPLTTRELKRMLRRFGIRVHNRWPSPRLKNSKSFLALRRTDFEPAWAEHCDETSTSPQASRIISLVKS